MGEGKITDKDQLKKTYLPLIVDQVKKGALPQTLRPRLTKMGFAESEADDLINEAIALAAPALGPKAAALRQPAKPAEAAAAAAAPEQKKPAKYVNYTTGSGGETAKAEQAYLEAKEKLLASGFNPFEAEKMARTKAHEVENESKREKLLAAGFGAEEAEKMLKSSATTSLYGQPIAPGGRTAPGVTANLDYAPGSATLYEDDGETIAYQSGGFSTFTIDTTQDINRLTIAIAPASGRFPWQPQTRAIECILHRSEQPHEVMVNGNPIAATYDQVSKETRIRLQCPTHDMTLITIIH